MSIDDKVSAKCQRFVFTWKENEFNFSPAYSWSKTEMQMSKKQKINLNCFPSTQKQDSEKSREMGQRWRLCFQLFFSIRFSLFFLSTLHILVEYIITACRCSLRIHSRAKWYRFFGNFHLEREELMYEILSCVRSLALLRLYSLTFSCHFIRFELSGKIIRFHFRSLSRSPFGRDKNYTLARCLSHFRSHTLLCWIPISVEFSVCKNCIQRQQFSYFWKFWQIKSIGLSIGTPYEQENRNGWDAMSDYNKKYF